MSARRIALAAWDFVVGDDWRLALAAVAAIGLTAVVCALGPSAWWLAPLVALGALWMSLRGAAPAVGPRPDGEDTPNPQADRPTAGQPDGRSAPK